MAGYMEQNDWLKTVGSRIKRARQDCEIFQIELSGACGIKPPQLSKWENGKAPVNPFAAIRLVAYLDMSLDYLYNGSDKQNSSGRILTLGTLI
jgi:transcriptional regulator with XRE-family HTH domain